MKLLRYFEKSQAIFLLSISVLFFLLRFPSLFEPYWYGDEGIYLVIGDALRNGRDLYSGIWDHKPPLLYLIYQFFGQNLFSIKFLSLILGIGAVLVFFSFSKIVLKSKKYSILSTLFFVILFGLPTLEGNIANAENFILLPILLGFYVLFKRAPIEINNFSDQLKKLKFKTIFLSGLFFGIAFLTKIVGAFDFAALIFFLFLITSEEQKNILLSLKYFWRDSSFLLIPLFLGFLLPTFLYTIFSIFQGNFTAFITSAYLDNTAYVGVQNNFFIPQGFLILKSLILIIILTAIYFKRKIFSRPLLFSICWFTFSIYNIFFSQRPYGHYLILVLPSIILLFFLAFNNHHFKKKIIIFVLITCVILVSTFNLFLAKKTLSYYGNFFKFVTGQKSTQSYLSYFDRNTPRDYIITTFIKSHTKKNETVFIWGESAQVYFMSGKVPPGKYTVSYHINSFKGADRKTEQAIRNSNVKYIIIMRSSDVLPFSLEGYTYIMTLEGAAIYAKSQ